jgi:cytochrome c oxidase subunit 3
MQNSVESTSGRDNLQFGFPVFLLSESLVFASFFLTYIVLRSTTSHWFPPGFPGLDTSLAIINTIILVTSSGVIYLAERALHQNHLIRFRRLWLLTILMGVVFLCIQGIEWYKTPLQINSGPAGGSFYLLTGFHGLHVLTGIILLLFIYIRSLIPGNYDSGHQGVNAIALFWHFVDVIWVILFLLLYIW